MSTSAAPPVVEAQEVEAPAGALVRMAGRVEEGGGLMRLAAMSDGEFRARLAHIKLGKERVREIQRTVLVAGEDYGQIPGTDRPTLYKAGAENLLQFYGLVPDPVVDVRFGDGKTAPPIAVIVKTEVHAGSLAGPVVGVGVGAASSWEVKYRYRKGSRACPECGADASIRRSKFEEKEGGKKGWWCPECKAQFSYGDKRIAEQDVGRVENPDPHELLNNLVKMGKKRSLVDSALSATATSAFFSQDVEDMDPETRKAILALREREAAKGRGGRPGGKAEPAKREGRAAKDAPAAKQQPQPNKEGQAPGPAKPAANGGAPLPEFTPEELVERIVAEAQLRFGESEAVRLKHKDWRGLVREASHYEVDGEVNEFDAPSVQVPVKWLRYTLKRLAAPAAAPAEPAKG